MLQGSQANKIVKTEKKLVKKSFRASYIACAAAWGTYPPRDFRRRGPGNRLRDQRQVTAVDPRQIDQTRQLQSAARAPPTRRSTRGHLGPDEARPPARTNNRRPRGNQIMIRDTRALRPSPCATSGAPPFARRTWRQPLTPVGLQHHGLMMSLRAALDLLRLHPHQPLGPLPQKIRTARNRLLQANLPRIPSLSCLQKGQRDLLRPRTLLHINGPSGMRRFFRPPPNYLNFCTHDFLQKQS